MVKTTPKHSPRPTTLMDRLEAEELAIKEGAKALGDFYADVVWNSCSKSSSNTLRYRFGRRASGAISYQRKRQRRKSIRSNT